MDHSLQIGIIGTIIDLLNRMYNNNDTKQIFNNQINNKQLNFNNQFSKLLATYDIDTIYG